MIPKIAILAGGLGTRLRPLTDTRPKALVEVLGIPFLTYQLSLIRRQNFTNVVLCVGHGAEQIKRHVGNGSEFGLTVEYSSDGTTPLGTAGALRLARPLLGEWFAVLDGDSYLPIDFHRPIQQFLRARTMGLMTVYRNKGQYGHSNVAVENGCVTCYDRSAEGLCHIHYGFSVLNAAILASVPAGTFCSMDTVYRQLVAAGQLSACMVGERFYEIGTPEGLEAFEKFVKTTKERSDAMDFFKELGGTV